MVDSTNSGSRRAFPRTQGGLLILRGFVLVPAACILACIAILASGALLPRSPYIATISLIIDSMSLVEVIAFVIFLRSLLKSYIARSRANVVLAVLGALSLLPALAVAILIVEGSSRH